MHKDNLFDKHIYRPNALEFCNSLKVIKIKSQAIKKMKINNRKNFLSIY